MNNLTGKIGELYTAEYLKKHGYNVLQMNFHSRFGEIDIIASDTKYIVFVEVKTRKAGSLVSPFEAVTKEKQRKLILAAKYYLVSHRTSLQPRFDVSAVLTENGVVASVDYLKNAFS